MFQIGEFSKFSRVSVKTLRYYDRLGLLPPARVDPESGYRYYSARQLPRLNRILALKDVGFTLRQIATMVGDVGDAVLVERLEHQQATLENELASLRRQLATVSARLGAIRERHSFADYEVVMRPVAALNVATLRRTVDDEAAIAPLFEEVEAYVEQHLARSDQPPLLRYHGDEYSDSVFDVEVAVPVASGERDHPHIDYPHIEVRRLPRFTGACVIHTGGYETIDRALQALLYWTEQHRYRMSAPLREVYLRYRVLEPRGTRPRAYVTDADDLVTELQLPIVPR